VTVEHTARDAAAQEIEAHDMAPMKWVDGSLRGTCYCGWVSEGDERWGDHVVDALLAPQETTCPNENDQGDGFDHTTDAGETPCPKAPEDDPGHCDHWYDAGPCCRCGDAGLPRCPTCKGSGTVSAPPLALQALVEAHGPRVVEWLQDLGVVEAAYETPWGVEADVPPRARIGRALYRRVASPLPSEEQT
jgi:hypothetical protein